MIQTFKYGGRKVLLNALEVQQITVRLPGDKENDCKLW